MLKTVQGASYFTGPEASKLAKKVYKSKNGVELTTDAKHLADKFNDLMNDSAKNGEPNTTLSALDVAILKDLGYTTNAPKWWPKADKKNKAVAQRTDADEANEGLADALTFVSVTDHNWIV